MRDISLALPKDIWTNSVMLNIDNKINNFNSKVYNFYSKI